MWARAHAPSFVDSAKRSTAFVRALAAAIALCLGTGCGLRVGANEEPPPAPCFHAIDCPQSTDPCVVSTCFEQQCAMLPAAVNTVLREQKAGDCRMRVCDGNGRAVEIVDDVDLPADDGNDCTSAMCANGAGKHEPVEVGESCGEGGVCNGKGKCGVCLPAAMRCDGNAVSTCSDEGAWEGDPCPAGKPICKESACIGLRQVATGGAHTCALFEDGTARCFGAGGARRGQVRVSLVPGISGAAELALGGAHACARKSDGSVVCWGHNGFGQVGDGTSEGMRPPTPVLGLSGATAIAAGEAFTCAIVAAGKVVCWGRSDTGQLGVPRKTTSTAAKKTEVVEVPSPQPARPGGPPSLVGGLVGAIDLALGGRHACALGPGGLVACWGEGESGELGDVPPPAPAKPKPGVKPKLALSPIPGIEGAVALSLGASFGCALLGDGTAHCWGDNGAGQLGDGTTDARTDVVVVKGVSGAKAIALGAAHGCALSGEGRVMCWGAGDRGQLGDGKAERRATPAEVPGLEGVRAITAGGSHTCAMLADGSVKCWGGNGAGEVGDGTTTDRKAPTAVAW